MSFCYLDIETLDLNPFESQVVAIGVDTGEKEFFAVGEDEIKLLTEFNEIMTRAMIPLKFWYTLSETLPRTPTPPLTPILVTYNGDFFDVPFLTSRALKHGIKLELYKLRHLDLMWVTRKFLSKQNKYPSLHELAQFLDIEVKDKFTGGDVKRLFEEKRFADIEAHLRSDVELTKKVHQRLRNLCDWDLKQRYERL